MKLSDFAALTFDCYGTLIDWEQGLLNELTPWTARHGLTISGDEILQTFASLEPKHQAQTPDKPYPQVLQAVYLDLAAHWRIPASNDEALAFGNSVGRWPAFADTAPSLQYLKHHSIAHHSPKVTRNSVSALTGSSRRRMWVLINRIRVILQS